MYGAIKIAIIGVGDNIRKSYEEDIFIKPKDDLAKLYENKYLEYKKVREILLKYYKK